MRYYLASNYSRRLELLGYAEMLKALGHEITSTWIDGHHETRPNIDESGTGVEKARWADQDVRDLLRAEALILFTGQPGPRQRGGKDTEFGYALGRGLMVFVVGPRVNVFHELPEVFHFADPVSFFVWVRQYTLKEVGV